MSYRKAEQLLALATLVAGRHVGVTLDDVIERFGVSKRTAQRMLRALETVFPDTVSTVDEQGRKRWRLPSAAAFRSSYATHSSRRIRGRKSLRLPARTPRPSKASVASTRSRW